MSDLKTGAFFGFFIGFSVGALYAVAMFLS